MHEKVTTPQDATSDVILKEEITSNETQTELNITQTQTAPHQTTEQEFFGIDDENEESFVDSAVEPKVSEEFPTVSPSADNYRAEDTDQYFDNGAYIPDQEEMVDSTDEKNDTSDNKGISSASPTIILIITAIASIAFGAALYYVLA